LRVAVAGTAGVIPVCTTVALSSLEMACVAGECFGDCAFIGVADTGFGDAPHHDSGKHSRETGVADIGFSDTAVDAPHDVARDTLSGN
jgi:hypothetical protein